MTTGTKTSGLLQNVRTDAGNTQVMDRYVYKTWTGADRVVKRVPKETDPLYRGKFVKMKYSNGRTVRIYVPPAKFRSKRTVPRRQYQEEHTYSMSGQTTTDNVFYSRQNNGYQIYTSMTAAQAGWASHNVNYGWTPSHEYALLSRLRQRVAGSDFDFGVFLGEGHEALRMITNAATRIYAASYALKRGDLGWAARSLVIGTDRQKLWDKKNPARNWLELQYGWLPLLGDAKAGAEFLAHKLNVPLQQVIRVSMRSSGSVSPTATAIAYSGATARTQKRLKAILRESNVQTLSGIVDPFTVAWELTPWSFVVDWFIPIGDYLQARGLASRLTGTYVTSTKQYYNTGKVVPRGITQILGECKFNRERTDMSRVISTSLNVPLPGVKGLGEVASWKRAANAVALLVTRAPRNVG